MGEYRKLNMISGIVYAAWFIFNVLYFWVFAGPTGLLDCLIWQYLILFILVPAILTALHVAIKGANKLTALLPVAFAILNQLNFFVTWNLLWVTQNGYGRLFAEFGTAIIMTLVSSSVGFVIGIAIRGVRCATKRKESATELN